MFTGKEVDDNAFQWFSGHRENLQASLSRMTMDVPSGCAK